MIKMKTVYYASDNTMFSSYESAQVHESGILKAWIETGPIVNLVDVLDTLDDNAYDEYNCTEKEMAMIFIQKAFELSQKE